MKLRTYVGQVFVTHPKDENFTSLYEEAFSKHGQTVELFAVLEISGSTGNLIKQRKVEYEKLFQILVSAFKRSYVASPSLQDDTFEKALAAINAALSRLMSKGRVDWYGKLNAAVGVLWQNQLMVSTTGNAIIYLVRNREWILLSEGLSQETRPVKIFTNYASGRVASADQVILSSKQLFNYLSLDRLREFLGEDSLAETCQEIIKALLDIKTTGFATFIFEVNSESAGAGQRQLMPVSTGETSEPAEVKPLSQGRRFLVAVLALLRQVGKAGFVILKFLWMILVELVGVGRAGFNYLFRKRSKTYLLGAIVIVLILLIASVGTAAWKKSITNQEGQTASVLNLAEQKLNEAEAALIYNDEAKILTLVTEAEKLLTSLKTNSRSGERQALEQRIQDLKTKVKKETQIEAPTILTSFSNIPTELIHSPNGFLGYNRNSNSVSFYDFRVGETKVLFKNQNLGRLILGEFVGGAYGYVFLDKSGKFVKLDLLSEELTPFEPAVSAVNPDLAKIQALRAFGEGTSARLYLLDTKQNQIWRTRVSDTGIGPGEPWLREGGPPALAEALDLAVDGNIYVLLPNRVDKYFNGQKQDFTLGPLSPPLKNALKIFTKPDYQFLYLLDPENQRILIFTKTGKLHRQITSPQFRDLSDIFVDEKNKIMYLLAGPELLQVAF